MSYPKWFAALKTFFISLFARSDGTRYGWSSHVRWPLLSVVVGIFAGLGAIFFEELLK